MRFNRRGEGRSSTVIIGVLIFVSAIIWTSVLVKSLSDDYGRTLPSEFDEYGVLFDELNASIKAMSEDDNASVNDPDDSDDFWDKIANKVSGVFSKVGRTVSKGVGIGKIGIGSLTLVTRSFETTEGATGLSIPGEVKLTILLIFILVIVVLGIQLIWRWKYV